MPLRPARWLGFFILGVVYFLFTSDAWASSVVINEIHPVEEWVELYNSGVEAFPLAGCTIFLDESDNTYQKIEFESGNEIDKFLVLEWGDSSWLANSGGDTVLLVCDGSSSKKVAYGNEGDLEIPKAQQSLARVPDGSNNWVVSSVPSKGVSNGGTPADSPFPSPSSSFSSSSTSNISNIFINEVMACPNTGEKEWIELYNANDQSVELISWRLRDSDDGHKQNFDRILSAKSLVKIEITGFSLNNDGDKVRLFADGDLKDSMNYQDCKKGYSWSKVNGSWCQTESSPEISNKSCVNLDDSSDSSPNPSPSLASSPQVLGTTVNTKTSKKIVLGRSTDSESMLGEFASFSGEVMGATESGEKEAEENEGIEERQNHNWLVPLGLSGSGLVLLGAASFPFVKPKVVSFLKKPKS